MRRILPLALLAAALPGCGTMLAAGALGGTIRGESHGAPLDEELGPRERELVVVALELGPPRLVCRQRERVAEILRVESHPGFDLPLRFVSISASGLEAFVAGMLFSISLEDPQGVQSGMLYSAALMSLDALVGIALGLAMPERVVTGSRIEQGGWSSTSSACGEGMAIELDGDRIPIAPDGSIAVEGWGPLYEQIVRYGTFLVAGPAGLARARADLDVRCDLALGQAIESHACEEHEVTGRSRIEIGVALPEP